MGTLNEDIEHHFENLKKLARDPHTLRGTSYEIKLILEPMRVRPRLSQLFEQSMSRVMRVNVILASHLTVWQAARAAEHRLAQSERELLSRLEFFSEVTATGDAWTTIDADKFNPGQLQQAANHARIAIKMLQNLFLSASPSLQRLRLWLYMPAEYRKYLGGRRVTPRLCGRQQAPLFQVGRVLRGAPGTTHRESKGAAARSETS